jgi:hypothetical protein
MYVALENSPEAWDIAIRSSLCNWLSTREALLTFYPALAQKERNMSGGCGT